MLAVLLKLVAASLTYDLAGNSEFVHRDLKPENFMLSETAASATLKIADFGFAKIVDDYYKSSRTTGDFPVKWTGTVVCGYSILCNIWDFSLNLK